MGHIIADVVFVLVGLGIIAFSAKRGFFRSLMRFAKGFLAIGAAYLFGNLLAPWLSKTYPVLGDRVLPMILSYVLVFVLALVALTVITWLMKALIDKLMIVKKIDTILGGVIGLLSALILMFIAASLLKFMPATDALYEKTAIIRFFGDSSILKGIKFLDIGRAWFETMLG